jgi:aspartyl-tRNA synthetase
MGFSQRTNKCGELRLAHVGQTVTVTGWAHKVRDLGGVVFIDLRDRTGIVQVTLDPARFGSLADLRSESCLSLSGLVSERSPSAKNSKIPTGDIEIVAHAFEVLGPSKPLPFPLSDEEQMVAVNEELRVRYRYLDLRRGSMYRRMSVRAKLTSRMRAYLEAQEFVEIETPIITKSTPEGARDYLVPYRFSPGSWYALPQSPQQYKQMLMVAGFERYFQVARCFRDESARADRQPEFTQLDVEMSFVTQEDVLNLAENLCRTAMNQTIEEFQLDKLPVEAFDRMTYDEAMNRYGCDKPDVRFGLPLFDLTEILRGTTFSVFQSIIESGGKIRGVRFPNGGSLSRKDVGALEEFCRELGAKGMATVVVPEDGESAKGSVGKYLSPEELALVKETACAQANDLLCIVAGDFAMTNSALYRLRLLIGDRLELRDPRILKYIWVTDFPLVDWDADGGRWSATHHPFTSPKDEDLAELEGSPGKVRANAYDMVCNGYECAGGSIRIHRADVQARIFDLLGISPETQQSQFGHLLEAFSYGAPPHGGIAFGLDRAVMLLTDTENIREVIAFPKIGNGFDPLMDSPSAIDALQWAELGLRLAKG